MSQKIDPNFLRRQREKREADKRAKLAEQAAADEARLQLDPLSRQKAIEAKIQELLNKAQPPTVGD